MKVRADTVASVRPLFNLSRVVVCNARRQWRTIPLNPPKARVSEGRPFEEPRWWGCPNVSPICVLGDLRELSWAFGWGCGDTHLGEAEHALIQVATLSSEWSLLSTYLNRERDGTGDEPSQGSRSKHSVGQLGSDWERVNTPTWLVRQSHWRTGLTDTSVDAPHGVRQTPVSDWKNSPNRWYESVTTRATRLTQVSKCTSQSPLVQASRQI